MSFMCRLLAGGSVCRVTETRDLFERARTGGPADLNAFYERCARKLLPLIRVKLGRTLRSEVESRDILQVVLCKSFERLDQVQDPAAVMGWMARMAENEIRDQADFHGRERRDAALRAPIDDAAAVPAAVRQALSLAIISEEMTRLETAPPETLRRRGTSDGDASLRSSAWIPRSETRPWPSTSRAWPRHAG